MSHAAAPAAPALEPVDFATEPLPGRALHALLARARESARLVPMRLAGLPALLVTRFADVRDFLADDEGHPGGAIYRFHTEPVVGPTFISMDGAEHRAVRQLTMPAFRSRAVAHFIDAELVPLAHEIVDRFAARGEADLVAELSGVLPYYAISRKLGLPAGSESRQRAWARAMLTHPVTPGAALAAAEAVTRFLEPIVEARRKEPGDDVLSHLLTAEHDGRRLTDAEVYAHVRLFYSVGASTTADGMSSLFWTVLTQPEMLERARADAALRPRIVRELLRCEPPVSTLPRLVSRGGVVAGRELPAGTFVLAGLAAANRDPAVFGDPDRFDPDRPESELMTFGHGEKFCPGSHLGRQQLLAALTVVLERLPGLRLVDAAPPTGAILRSVPQLRVAWDARAARG
jgi:cytochrome P450